MVLFDWNKLVNVSSSYQGLQKNNTVKYMVQTCIFYAFEWFNFIHLLIFPIHFTSLNEMSYFKWQYTVVILIQCLFKTQQLKLNASCSWFSAISDCHVTYSKLPDPLSICNDNHFSSLLSSFWSVWHFLCSMQIIISFQ